MKNIEWRRIGLEVCAWTAAAAEELFKMSVRWCKSHQRLVTKIEKVLIWALVLGTVALICSNTVRKQERAKYAAALLAAQQQHTAEMEQARIDMEQELKTAYGFDQIDQERDQIQVEAESLARLAEWLDELGTTEEGKRSSFWCVFNRADSNLYPSTIEGVLAQTGQFDGYKPSGTFTMANYSLALGEVQKWHSGGARPMRADLLFLVWTPDGVILKSQLSGGKGCHYWYEDDWAEVE